MVDDGLDQGHGLGDGFGHVHRLGSQADLQHAQLAQGGHGIAGHGGVVVIQGGDQELVGTRPAGGAQGPQRRTAHGRGRVGDLVAGRPHHAQAPHRQQALLAGGGRGQGQPGGGRGHGAQGHLGHLVVVARGPLDQGGGDAAGERRVLALAVGAQDGAGQVAQGPQLGHGHPTQIVATQAATPGLAFEHGFGGRVTRMTAQGSQGVHPDLHVAVPGIRRDLRHQGGIGGPLGAPQHPPAHRGLGACQAAPDGGHQAVVIRFTGHVAQRGPGGHGLAFVAVGGEA